jgi:hypothetical protein
MHASTTIQRGACALAVAVLCSCSSTGGEEPGAAKPATRQEAALNAESTRWCASTLQGVDWQADPLQVLQAHAMASRDCDELMHEKHQLLLLGLMTYIVLGKELSIRNAPTTTPAERVRQLLQDGVDKQASVTYAGAGDACKGDADGLSLLRVAFKPGGLASFLPGAEPPASRLAGAGLSTRELERGVLGTLAPDANNPCTTMVFVGEDELISVQARDAAGIEALISEARSRAASAALAPPLPTVVAIEQQAYAQLFGARGEPR